MTKEDKIDSSSKKDADKKKGDTLKDDKGKPLTEQDIALIKRYGKGPYHDKLKDCEGDIKTHNAKVTALCGIKESDTGLALPA